MDPTKLVSHGSNRLPFNKHMDLHCTIAVEYADLAVIPQPSAAFQHSRMYPRNCYACVNHAERQRQPVLPSGVLQSDVPKVLHYCYSGSAAVATVHDADGMVVVAEIG